MEETKTSSITNYWLNHDNNEKITAICLMDGWGVVRLLIHPTATFKELKEIVYSELGSSKGDSRLTADGNRQILYVGDNTCLQEIKNENTKLVETNFFIPVFRLICPQKGSSPRKSISQLLNRFSIDYENTLATHQDLDQQRAILNLFMLHEYQKFARLSPAARFVCNYPQQIKKVDSLTTKHQAMLINKKQLTINFFYSLEEGELLNFTLEVPVTITIEGLRSAIFGRLKNSCDLEPNLYALKLAGKREFFTGELNMLKGVFDESIRLIDYKEIQQRILDEEKVNLTIFNWMQVFSEAKKTSFVSKNEVSNKRKSSDKTNIWNINPQQKFGLVIKAVETEALTHYMLKVGLYYGETLLDKVIDSRIFLNSVAYEEEVLTFDIPLFSLPINTKVCVALYGTRSKPGQEPKPKYMNPCAWVNINLSDFNGYVHEAINSLYMYTCPILKSDNGLYPLGTTIPTYNEKVKFKLNYRFSIGGKSLFYPMETQMKATLLKKAMPKRKDSKDLSDDMFFQEMSDWLTFSDLTVEQRDRLWQELDVCYKKYPLLIPKILQSMPDFSKRSICKAFVFLKRAPLLSEELSLELLRSKFCHPIIRSYLVKNLEQFSNENLEIYMTQIVEAMKLEQHIYNDLTLFLLKRALNNRRVAHFLLWNLLSEHKNIEVAVRNSIIIETYCSAKPDHLEDILKQVEMVNRLKNFYEVASVNNVTDKYSLLELFKNYIKYPKIADNFSGLSCPLDPSFYLSQLKLEECKVMESKKKPILLVFQSEDAFASKVRVLYKYGDDLRQDALVMTCLKIIGQVCESFDPEIRFTCYSVLNSGHMEGLIQLVDDSTTLGTIQAERGFKSQTLHEWFCQKYEEEKQMSPQRLEEGCRRFAASCAAYSVMTYILGIGDRHNDNIMIHKSGRLFHIDFGHILGHFKSFYGIKRERAPFIMTKDFLYFATNGTSSKSDIATYCNYCANLFVKIREVSFLIFLPILLMVNSGLPELQSESDIYYITNAIDFRLDAAEAKKKFEEKFNEACTKSWSTELNFKAHNMRVAGQAKGKAQSNLSKVVLDELEH